MSKASLTTNSDTDDPLSSKHSHDAENSHSGRWIYLRRKTMDNIC